MVALVLLSLAAGIATTIGTVALLAILLRSSVGAALMERLPSIERNARVLQGGRRHRRDFALDGSLPVPSLGFRARCFSAIPSGIAGLLPCR